MSLTSNAIPRIANQLKVDNPVLQVVSNPPELKPGEKKPIRLYISDGVSVLPAIISGDKSEELIKNSLKMYSIIQLTHFTPGNYQGQLTVFVSDYILVQQNYPQRIGNPDRYGKPKKTTESPASTSGAPQTAAPSPPHPSPLALNPSEAQQSGQMAQLPQSSASPQPTATRLQSYQQQPPQPQIQPQQQLQQAPQSQFQPQIDEALRQLSLLPTTETGQIQVMPIASLSPYSTRNWCIKARVTVRPDIKEFNRGGRGRMQRDSDGMEREEKGKLLSCDILDEFGGETRIVMFNDAVDKFGPIIQKGGVYFIHKGRVRSANKQFCRFEVEITLDTDSVVVPLPATEGSSQRVKVSGEGGEAMILGDDPHILMMKWDFIDNIAQLEKVAVGNTVDVCGIIVEEDELRPIQSKRSSTPLSKKSVWVADHSMKKIEVTFWGKEAEQLSANIGDSLSIKAARVGEFQGKTLTVGIGSTFELNDEGHQLPQQLRLWWRQSLEQLIKEGDGNPSNAFAALPGTGMGPGGRLPLPRTTLRQAMAEGAGTEPGRDDLFSVLAMPVYLLKDNITYAACPKEGCGRKLVGNSCPKHPDVLEGEDGLQPQIRYLVNSHVADSTGCVWVSMFGNQAQELIGEKPEIMAQLQVNEPERYELAINERLFLRYEMRIRARQDTYQGDSRVRYSCMSIFPIDFARESALILNSILKLIPQQEKESLGLHEVTPPPPQTRSLAQQTASHLPLNSVPAQPSSEMSHN